MNTTTTTVDERARRIETLRQEERDTRPAHLERVRARKAQRALLQAHAPDGLVPRLPIGPKDRRYHNVVATLMALDADRDAEWISVDTGIRCQKSRGDIEGVTLVRTGRQRPPTPPGFWTLDF